MGSRRAPRVPAAFGLGPRGAAAWQSVTADFELNAAEEALLRIACAALDTVDELEAAVREHGATRTRADGTPAASPLLIELRLARDSAARAWAAVRLPDPDDEALNRPQRRALRGYYRTGGAS